MDIGFLRLTVIVRGGDDDELWRVVDFATGRFSVAGCSDLMKCHSILSVCVVFHQHGLCDSSTCEDGCRALATGGR